MSFLDSFAFNYYPYIAISVFLVGSIYRYENNQYSWKTSSSQILRKSWVFLGSNFFHFGILFLMFGHFFGLMTPKFIYSKIISPDSKQILAMITGGFAAIICVVGLVILLYRRMGDFRVRLTGNKSDVFVLILLYLQLLLGLLSIFISYQHIDNPSTMISLANWVQGIFLFSPDLASYVVNENWVFKTHLFLGMTVFLVFPFTRLVHVLSFPYMYLLRAGYQIVRSLK